MKLLLFVRCMPRLRRIWDLKVCSDSDLLAADSTSFVIQLFFFLVIDLYRLIFADPATLAAYLAGKEEVDARSVFVGNVRTLMRL